MAAKFYINTSTHVLIACVVVYMTVLCQALRFQDTALHAFLCTIGYHLLMVEGIMVFYPANVLTRKFSRKWQTRIHVGLQAIGGAFGMVGGTIKVLATEDNHFATLHGKFGLAANLLSAWAMANGLATLYSHKLTHISPMKIKTIHNAVGLTACVVGLFAVLLGFGTPFAERVMDASVARLLALATYSVILLSAYWPFVALVRRIRVVFRK